MSSLAKFLSPVAIACFACPMLLAQGSVHVVDVDAGPGFEFTSIQTAVQNAGDGDTILVRDGVYDESVFISGKALTLQTETGASVAVSLGLRIANTLPGKTVSVRGMFLDNDPLLGGRSLQVTSCAGPVWIEDVTVAGNAPLLGGGAEVTNSSSVTLNRCTILAFDTVFLPDQALDICSSAVALLSCTVDGVLGTDTPFGTPGPGYQGIQLDASTLFASNSTLTGGAGGSYFGDPGNCADGAMGGVGLTLLNNSVATLFDTNLQGGPGGSSTGTCAQGPTGEASDIEAGSVLIVNGRALGQLVGTSPVREGANIDATVTAEAGAVAFILYSATATSAIGSPVFDGQLLVSVQPFQFISLGNLPASGILTLSTPAGLLAPGQESMPVYAQVMSISPLDGRILVGDSTLVTILDSAF